MMREIIANVLTYILGILILLSPVSLYLSSKKRIREYEDQEKDDWAIIRPLSRYHHRKAAQGGCLLDIISLIIFYGLAVLLINLISPYGNIDILTPVVKVLDSIF